MKKEREKERERHTHIPAYKHMYTLPLLTVNVVSSSAPALLAVLESEVYGA